MDTGALLAASTSMANTAMNAASQQKTNRWQLKLAQYAYDQERQMIQEQNEYNSPLQQLKRYEEAGLNPNLIYGEGKASAGNQSGIAQYRAPNLVAPQFSFDEAIQKAVGISQARAQIQKMENESYASKMLGIKYEQEGQSAYMRNLFDSVVLGITPGITYIPEDLQKVKGSLKLRGYSAEVQGREFQNSLIQSQAALSRANEKLISMKSDAQDYYNKNIQPLVSEIMQKKAFGIDISNEIANLQKKFFQADKYFHYGEALLHDILQGINMFRSPIQVPSSPSQSPSWYGSPFYPNESYAPGL